MRIELHCHSTCSDGSHPPEVVARRAEAAGVELFCLTDHDTCAGSPVVADRGGRIQVLRGTEVSLNDGRRTVHVLFYDVAGDRRWDELEQRLAELRGSRRRRVGAICARLAELGIHIDADAILAHAADRTVGRPDVARAMVEAGAVESRSEAFDRYLHDGGPADVPVARISIEDGLALGRRVGARMSLAHPHLYGRRAEDLLRRCRAHGLEGLEAFYGVYRAGERNEWLALARRYQMVATGGSDFHGEQLPQITEPAGVDMPEPHASRLREWLGA